MVEIRIPYQDSIERRPTRMQELQRNNMLVSVTGKVLNRIILERLKNEVDDVLRDHQAGFRQDRGCRPIDQISTLRIVV